MKIWNKIRNVFTNPARDAAAKLDCMRQGKIVRTLVGNGDKYWSLVVEKDATLFNVKVYCQGNKNGEVEIEELKD